MSMGFVCLMGMGTVFIGLICIILLCTLTGMIVRAGEKKTKTVPSEKQTAQPGAAEQSIPDRQKMLAAVCAAVAEDLGTDISALRVVSFKKL